MSDPTVGERRRREVIDALRRGTVPANGLDLLAVGLDRFEPTTDAELRTVAEGGSVFKAVRGEYGAGKTFFSRWLVELARKRGFASAEVRISETETPLHRLETAYRRVTESLTTAEFPASANSGCVVPGPVVGARSGRKTATTSGASRQFRAVARGDRNMPGMSHGRPCRLDRPAGSRHCRQIVVGSLASSPGFRQVAA